MTDHVEQGFISPIVGQIVTRRELQSMFGVSSRTIDRLVRAGVFPAPFHVGRSCRWLIRDVEAFIGEQGVGRGGYL